MIRTISAALLGASCATLYAWLTGIAFHAHSRDWEMGGIPLLFAAWMFVGLSAGIVAGLTARERPYLAAFLATFVLLVIAATVNGLKEELTPGMTRDERREYWANIEGLLFAGFPVGIPFALWGALIVDLKPLRLRGLRSASYQPAGFLSFVALFPMAFHWLPGSMGFFASVVAAVLFFSWIARRNRSAKSE
jgi:hypothetical protein